MSLLGNNSIFLDILTLFLYEGQNVDVLTSFVIARDEIVEEKSMEVVPRIDLGKSRLVLCEFSFNNRMNKDKSAQKGYWF